MTLHEVSKQLYKLSCAGFFNGHKCRENELYEYLKSNLEDKKIGSWLPIEITLDDGRWKMKVTKYAGGYDYFIPETREQEERLQAEIAKLPFQGR